MFKFWKGRDKKESVLETSEASTPSIQASTEEKLVLLRGRNTEQDVAPVVGMTILELAERNEVEWNSFCKRGTCARCRCYVSEGMEYMSAANEAEENRLDPEEIDDGYRLGCQTKFERIGVVSIKHAPYF